MAADLGHAEAQFFLGRCYFEGEGVDVNEAEGFKYYKLSADQGNIMGLKLTADCYISGIGTEINCNDAYKCYELASRQADSEAQFQVGLCLFKGFGVSHNQQEAIRYFTLAAEQEHVEAQYYLGYCHKTGDNAIQSFFWYMNAANNGHAAAQHIVGQCYLDGDGVPQHTERGFNYVKLSADQGNRDSQLLIAEIYHKGRYHISINQSEAVRYYNLAAQNQPRNDNNLVGFSTSDNVTVDNVLIETKSTHLVVTELNNWFISNCGIPEVFNSIIILKLIDNSILSTDDLVARLHSDSEFLCETMEIPLAYELQIVSALCIEGIHSPSTSSENEHTEANFNVIVNNVAIQQNTIINNTVNVTVEQHKYNVRATSLNDQIKRYPVETLYELDPKPAYSHDYRSELGRGMFGVTHKTRNIIDKGQYAVKLIRVRYAEEDAGIKPEDMIREASILQLVHHTYIVRYFTSFFSHEDSLFNLVMELIPGGSIAKKIKDQDVTILTVVKWLNQIASALRYLHVDKNIQHRDLKPENILLTANEDIKIIDMGLACFMKSSATRASRAGTLIYYSYEKTFGQPYDGRDDIWAAGCVIAELLLKIRLLERGGAIAMYSDAATNQRRLKLIEDCIAVDALYGAVIEFMLEPEQQNRCTSTELVEILASNVDTI